MPPLSMQILCNFNGNIVLSGTGIWFSLIVTLINPYHCCCCCSVTQLCPTLCASMDCNTPGFPVLNHLPELAQTHVHWVSDAIQSSHPLLSPSPAFNLSQHQGLFYELALHIRWLKYCTFSFSINPSNEFPGLISFMIDWLDLFTVQETYKSLFQHHSSEASILWHSAFFWSTSHIHTWLLEKTIVLIIQTFVSK